MSSTMVPTSRVTMVVMVGLGGLGMGGEEGEEGATDGVADVWPVSATADSSFASKEPHSRSFRVRRATRRVGMCRRSSYFSLPTASANPSATWDTCSNVYPVPLPRGTSSNAMLGTCTTTTEQLVGSCAELLTADSCQLPSSSPPSCSSWNTAANGMSKRRS